MFFLCSILSTYSIRSFPQPLARSRLVWPASVYIGILISILLYFKPNFLCDNASPDSKLLFRMIRWTVSPGPSFPFSFSSSYSPLIGTVWQRLRPLSHLQYSILLPESLSQVPLCWYISPDELSVQMAAIGERKSSFRDSGKRPG